MARRIVHGADEPATIDLHRVPALDIYRTKVEDHETLVHLLHVAQQRLHGRRPAEDGVLFLVVNAATKGTTFPTSHGKLTGGVVPGATIERLRTVRSHVHALSQCRQLIRSLGLEPLS